LQQFPLHAVELLDRHAFGWQLGPAVNLSDAENDVAAALVVKIAGDGAQRPQDGAGVPSFLKFHAVGLQLAAV
jgi:hypothetical protein